MALQDDSGHDEDSSSSSFVLPPPARPSPHIAASEAIYTATPSSISPKTSILPALKSDPTSTATSSSAAVSNGSPAAVAAPAPTPPAPAFHSKDKSDSQGPKANGDMSSHHHYPGGPGNHQYSQPPPYAATSAAAYPPSSAVSLSPSQFTSYSPSAVAAPSGDPYRSNTLLNSPMSLPSMRTIDPTSHQHGAPHLAHSPVGMAMSVGSAPVPSSIPYYPHQPLAASPSYGLHQDGMARYPIPHDPRLMGTRGPKKCDETHPTCNNCKKSKRDCLGYDPIFRQQPGGGQSTSPLAATHSLLGAGGPQSSPASQPTTPSSASAPVNIPSSATNVGPRQTATYSSQPPPFLSSSYPSNQSPTPTPIATPTSATSTTLGYDPNYSSNPSASASSIKPEPCYPLSSVGLDHTFRMLPSTSMHDSTRPLDSRMMSDHNTHLRAKKMRIDEIIDLMGPPPPTHQINQTEDMFIEITKVYHEMYAGGLSAFFETTWYYFVEDGKMAFPRDPRLVEHFASFLRTLQSVKANDHTQMAYSGVLETRIVWELARTARQSPERTNSGARVTLPPEGDAVEASSRLHVVEALLCGDYLSSNPLAPPIQDMDVHRIRQFDFWYNLAEFVRRREDPDSQAAVKARDDILNRMRHLLDGRENRDILYSIAVVRELAPNYDPGFGSTLPQHLDESDPKNRLAVASKFIMDEAQVTGGTTNVVRRFSDIAARAFVNPGVNVARRN
ncbi:hypothetical protein HJFPF1_00774 [Paramyrothecium foliicola]|nr:hypothetical protein HJFPF1_00774 [Paramyrothecium foliicola]